MNEECIIIMMKGGDRISRFYQPNTYDIQDDIVIVHAKHGDFIIDKEDLDKIRQYKWILTDNGKGHKKFQGHLPNNFRNLVSIPQVIFGTTAPSGFCYDHIDRDITNNRKSNLRIATPRQNGRNLSLNPNNNSGYTGVCPYNSKWRVFINYDGSIHLGDYAVLADACWARWVGEWVVYENFRNLDNARNLWKEGIKSRHKREIYERVLETIWKKIMPKIEERLKKEDR